MPDIKTRDVVKGTVKVIDKSAVAAERIKDAYVRTKDKAEHSVFAAESSPEEGYESHQGEYLQGKGLFSAEKDRLAEKAGTEHHAAGAPLCRCHAKDNQNGRPQW